MKKGVLYIVEKQTGLNNENQSCLQVYELIQYCKQKDIKVDQVFIEIHEGKSLEQPKLVKLFNYVMKNKIDFILITKWCNFSRDPFATAEIISIFREMNIEVQAINQPIDFNDPQSELTLSIYLTANELKSKKHSDKIRIGNKIVRIKKSNK